MIFGPKVSKKTVDRYSRVYASCYPTTYSMHIRLCVRLLGNWHSYHNRVRSWAKQHYPWRWFTQQQLADTQNEAILAAYQLGWLRTGEASPQLVIHCQTDHCLGQRVGATLPMRGETHGPHSLCRCEQPIVPVLYKLVHGPAITGDSFSQTIMVSSCRSQSAKGVPGGTPDEHCTCTWPARARSGCRSTAP